MKIPVFTVIFALLSAALHAQENIIHIDLNDQADRQVVVDREQGQYLGHPTTVLLEDGQTMLCVYPKGHGKGGIVYKRSDDGGLTWSDRLPTPDSWSTSREVPTLHRVIDAQGNKRIIMFSGLYPARMAVTEDDGVSWSELEQVGDWGGIVVMGCVIALQSGPGHYMAMFHDDGRFIADQPRQDEVRTFTLYKTLSTDGGLTWSDPEAVHRSSEKHICEPGVFRSPDGGRLAVLLRENSRRKNSQIIFSDDEGATWTEPRPMSDPLNGDRHAGVYLPDGRLFISFRKRSPSPKQSAYEGDWVAWIGTWQDLVDGGSGQYLVRLRDNHKDYDCAYPGVEILDDGTVVTTTYGHWDAGESPYILSVRITARDLDELADR
ncbi:MAG: sialidase family protein [Pirellulaceae bacterium]